MTKQDAIETIRMVIAQVEWEYPMNYTAAFEMAVEALSQPEIIRCKDCKHYDGDGTCMKIGIAFLTDDWFCAYGERRDG